MLSLDVSISTYKPEGIFRVEKMLAPLTPREGVRYIVSWQEHENTPVPVSLLQRKDTEIFRFEGRGLSNNRNNALDHCQGDIILIADDDLQYYPDFAEKIIEAFEQNPEMDFGTFQIEYSEKKIYPPNRQVIKIPFPKGYYGSTVEFGIRRNKIGDLRFWPGIGPGSDYLLTGEDEVFLISAIKRGLKVVSISSEIGKHLSSTTGSRVSPGVLRGQGFIIRLLYPGSFPLRLILKAYRVSKNKNISFIDSLYNLSEGALYSMKVWTKTSRKYRW